MYGNKKLTQKQSEVLQFLREQDQEKVIPTYREIAKHFGFKSPRSALDHVHALEKKGYLRRRKGHARGIELLLDTKSTIPIPILGNIPAGPPEEKKQFQENFISIDGLIFDLPKNHRLFALKVKGNSMKDRGIYNGDWVVVDKDSQPYQGEVVVALIDDKNTLKTLVKKKGEYYLKAENPDCSDCYPLKEIKIQGVVKMVIRRL